MSGLEKPAEFLLGQYGALAMGWVLSAILLAALFVIVRWFLSEQKEWRRVAETRAEAYHSVVLENTETMAKQSAVFEERTREIVEYIRRVRR